MGSIPTNNAPDLEAAIRLFFNALAEMPDARDRFREMAESSHSPEFIAAVIDSCARRVAAELPEVELERVQRAIFNDVCRFLDAPFRSVGPS